MKVDPRIALTGRVRTSLEYPEKGTMPVSCTVYKYANELHPAMVYVDIALRGGAGINMILDEFIAIKTNLTALWLFECWGNRKNNSYLCTSELSEGEHLRTIKVADSMEDDGNLPSGTVSIQDSWGIFYDHLIEGVPVVVDLSLLRPKGTVNEVGLEASGAESFATIYGAIAAFVNTGQVKELMNIFGTLNEVLRRGGQYKNGIVTFSMCTTNPNIVKYLNIPLSELTGSAKKGVRVEPSVVNDKRLFNLINVRLRDKSLMLEKVNQTNKHLYSNVCREIVLAHSGTCLILHSNLGMCATAQDIIESFEIGMNSLVDLHFKWQRHSQYADSSHDKQVGFGVIGLANLLARLGIKYNDFIKALRFPTFLINKLDDIDESTLDISTSMELVKTLYFAYHKAGKIAKAAGLERAFTIAPTQTCAYNHIDLLGNTTCKNINPPLACRVQRKSGTMGHMNKWYCHGEVEVISDVLKEWDIFMDSVDPIQGLWEGWQRMMNFTGLAHTVSFDLYVQPDAKGVWLKDFLTNSPLQTIYYASWENINQSYLNKGALTPTCDLEKGCIACGE